MMPRLDDHILDVLTMRTVPGAGYHHLISWIKTTFVVSPCHPLSPEAVTKKRQEGSTTAKGVSIVSCFQWDGENSGEGDPRYDSRMDEIVPP